MRSASGGLGCHTIPPYTPPPLALHFDSKSLLLHSHFNKFLHQRQHFHIGPWLRLSQSQTGFPSYHSLYRNTLIGFGC